MGTLSLKFKLCGNFVIKISNCKHIAWQYLQFFYPLIGPGSAVIQKIMIMYGK